MTDLAVWGGEEIPKIDRRGDAGGENHRGSQGGGKFKVMP